MHLRLPVCTYYRGLLRLKDWRVINDKSSFPCELTVILTLGNLQTSEYDHHKLKLMEKRGHLARRKIGWRRTIPRNSISFSETITFSSFSVVSIFFYAVQGPSTYLDCDDVLLHIAYGLTLTEQTKSSYPTHFFPWQWHKSSWVVQKLTTIKLKSQIHKYKQ